MHLIGRKFHGYLAKQKLINQSCSYYCQSSYKEELKYSMGSYMGVTGEYSQASFNLRSISGKGRHAINFLALITCRSCVLSKTWRAENLIVQGRERCSSENSSNYSLPMEASNKFIAACESGELNIIKELVKSKEVTDPNALTGELNGWDGCTPLHFAC